ncbi:hypothetical protein [Lysinibacillus sp. CTST325]
MTRSEWKDRGTNLLLVTSFATLRMYESRQQTPIGISQDLERRKT